MRTAKEIQEEIQILRLSGNINDTYKVDILEWVLEGDGWIKCSDRLPDIPEGDRYISVITYSSISGIQIEIFCNSLFDGKRWKKIIPGFDDATVTHWRELPELPEESK